MGKTNLVAFRLQDKELDELKEIAADEDGNQSAVVRRLIRDEYRRFKKNQANRELAAEVQTGKN